MNRKQLAAVLVLSMVPGLALAGGPGKEKHERADVAAVQGFLVPLTVDMASVEVMAAGLEQMAVVDEIRKEEVRNTAYLADQAINIAHARAQQLEQVPELADADRSKVKAAVAKLRDARESVDRLQSSIAGAPGELRRQDLLRLREEAQRLHALVMDAQLSLDGLPREYGLERWSRVSTSGR